MEQVLEAYNWGDSEYIGGHKFPLAIKFLYRAGVGQKPVST